MVLSLLPCLWWTSTFLLFMSLFQEVYLWTPVIAGAHFLPMGGISFVVMMFSGYLQSHFKLKTIILTGSALLIPATILFPFGFGKDRYWPILFPAFLIGSVGATLLYSNANIAMFKTTPPTMAGTVGAVFNAVLQIGSAVGIAAITSIETNVEARSIGGSTNFNGRAAGVWFLLALVVLETVSIVVFLKEYDEETATNTRSNISSGSSPSQ